MRLKIIFRPEGVAIFGWNYTNYLRGVLYRALERASPPVATALHDLGLEADGKVYKLLTFSPLFPKEKRVLPTGIQVKGDVVWLASSPLGTLMEALAQGLLELGRVQIGEVECSVRGVEVMPERNFGREARFVTLPPIVASTGIREGGKLVKKFLSPDHPDFHRVLAQNLARKYRALHGKEPEGSIRFEFHPPFKSKLVEINGTKVRGYKMRLTLRGEPGLIKLAYEAGLGERTAQGFGMLELLDFVLRKADIRGDGEARGEK
ncbi:MAG TPA: CRISPR-associated endoribonuclease Cas6 [Armatimonadetes bacterium]|nr:CRISPR-associated endoribonuclease Cas6 [Armatimonadota bacterium]